MLRERETEENLRTKFPTDRKPYTNDYDYEEDSDLEEDDGEDILEDELTGVPQVTAGQPGNTDDDIITIENLGVKTNEPSEIISVSDLDSLFSGLPDAGVRQEPLLPLTSAKSP